MTTRQGSQDIRERKSTFCTSMGRRSQPSYFVLGLGVAFGEDGAGAWNGGWARPREPLQAPERRLSHYPAPPLCVCVCVCVCVPNSLRTWLRGTGLVGRLQSPRHPESRVFLPTCMPEKHKQNSVLCAPMLQAYPRDSDVEEEK